MAVKFIVDVQDLWPEAFGMAIKNKYIQKLLYPMKLYVDFAYSRADLAIGVSQTYVNRVLSVNKKIESGLCVYLGNNAQLFDSGRSKYRIDRKDDEIWIGYVGSMGDSYDIGCIIEAISILQKNCLLERKIRFVLCGDGEKRSYFKHLADDKFVTTDFLGQKTYEEMAGILCSCDIVVNPIVKGSVASIINKVGDYALSGLPVINTQESIEYRNLIDDNCCGINCNCGDALSVAKAIQLLSNDEYLRLKMGNNHRLLGLECFDRLKSYDRIVNTIEENCQKGKIIIIANFASRLDGTANGRFTYLAEMLSDRGWDVEVVTSTFNHGRKKNDNIVTGDYKSKITLISEPGYDRNISIKRLYSHWVWGRNVRKYLNSLEEKPTVIYCAIPSLTAAVQASLFCGKN